MGKRVSNLAQARLRLEKNGIHIMKTSSVYETQPMELKEQRDFFNQAVKVKTFLEPYELLKAAKKIEKECGRKKTVRYGPRTMDIDILWWGGGRVKKKNLIIPHPRVCKRKFVLVPWMEIAGKNFVLHGKPLNEWLKQIDNHGDVQKVKLYSH